MTSLTPEQRICDYITAHPELRAVEGYIHIRKIDELAAIISDAERAAAEAERECCARQAEGYPSLVGKSCSDSCPACETGRGIAEAIRARGTGTKAAP